MTAPAFPPPDASDPPEVATPLRNAAALWSAGRHRDALPLLAVAAKLAGTHSSDPSRYGRVIELAAAARELADFVEAGEDPRSIPISLEFDTASIDVSSIDIVQASIPVHLELGERKRPPPPPRARTFAATLREDARPKPDTAKAEPPRAAAPPARVSFNQTLPQGVRTPELPPEQPKRRNEPKRAEPSAADLAAAPLTEPDDEPESGAETKRLEDIPTKRAPGE